MKKSFYISLLLFIFALTLSGCGSKKTAENKVDSSGNVVATENSDEEEFTASAFEMMGRGRSLHCTFSYEDEKEGAKQSGDFYVDGRSKKFRSEGESTTKATKDEPAMTIKMKSISDGVYAYSWTSLNEKTGFKMKLDQAVATSTDKNKETQDINQAVKFRCRPWTVDNSLFVVPSDINFTDMDEMMKKITAPAQGGGIDLCAICNQTPDATQKGACQKTNCK